MMEKLHHLPIGTKVRLYGTVGDVFKVVAYRLSHQGIWYTFQGTDGLGGVVQGYRELVKEVL